jgi:hypothetical protein
MAGELSVKDKAKIVELAELLAVHSSSIKAWAKDNSNISLLSGMAYGVFMSMHGVAQCLIEMVEESK